MDVILDRGSTPLTSIIKKGLSRSPFLIYVTKEPFAPNPPSTHPMRSLSRSPQLNARGFIAHTFLSLLLWIQGKTRRNFCCP